MVVGSALIWIFGQFLRFGRKFYQIVNCLKNNVAWLFIAMQVCWPQTAEAGSQSLKSVSVGIIAAHGFNSFPKISNIGVINFFSHRNSRFQSDAEIFATDRGNLRFPFTQETKKSLLATGNVTAKQQPMTEIAASQSTTKNRQNLHDLCEALYPLVASFGYIVGWWWYDKWPKIRQKIRGHKRKSLPPD